MKNKRNTRRGRARRWRLSYADVWEMSGHDGMVSVWYPRGECWMVFHRVQFGPFSSRAAAMRAAEHLARRR